MNTNVLNAIDGELQYQDQKWPGHTHSVGEYILIAEKCLADAKRKWQTCLGDDAALHEIRQVAAVCVACMEEHYAPERGVPIQNGKGQEDLPVRDPLSFTEQLD